ncbi:hypothetical protein RF663_03990 [Aeromonas veronii]|uniref:hypothetical protein n=1 Tax=Aeromonas veronii TaxID=654 RepID=UPI0028530AC9|nr:hypothetical protein [Aeromonas veronii]MDR5013408.1 hypothetical protein [Aeromonas veronii]
MMADSLSLSAIFFITNNDRMAGRLAVLTVLKMGDRSRFGVFVWVPFLCFSCTEHHKVKWLTNSAYFLILIVNLVVETPTLGTH